MNYISNEFFLQNIKSFSFRFPQLAQELGIKPEHSQQTFDYIKTSLEKWNNNWKTEQAKNGETTLTIDGKFLHSKYNPSAEAEKTEAAVFSSETQLLIFMGLGLGYQPLAFSKKRSDTPILIIEPNPAFIYLALISVPLGELFSHEKLYLFYSPNLELLPKVIAQTKTEIFSIIEQPNIKTTNPIFFADAKALISRIQTKNEINTATRKKFASLWIKNICKNINFLKTCPGIYRFKNIACYKENFDVLILAAGPSLDKTLPFLQELQKKMIIVCVDTALRACLAQNVEPDFIILIDPQYWNSRHISDLKAPNSILITESATFPSVFRFQCKKIFLCSSLFPLGQFLEQNSEIKGELAAGGSVATSAWDFARMLSPKNIYIAGLDLGFPKGNTHFKGSLFEENAIIKSNRITSPETASCESRFSGGKIDAADYNGQVFKTDKRLKMYAWWFESKLADPNIGKETTTFVIGKSGLAIPGMKTCEIEDLLQKPELRKNINSNLKTVSLEPTSENVQNAFKKAVDKLLYLLTELKTLCFFGLEETSDRKKSEIIERILQNPARNLISMMYFSEENESQEILLTKILNATDFHLTLLSKNLK